MTEPIIQVYGKPDCPDYARAKAVLQEFGAEYVFHNILASDDAAARAAELSGGARSPVLLLPCGAVLTEPSDEELRRAL